MDKKNNLLKINPKNPWIAPILTVIFTAIVAYLENKVSFFGFILLLLILIILILTIICIQTENRELTYAFGLILLVLLFGLFEAAANNQILLQNKPTEILIIDQTSTQD